MVKLLASAHFRIVVPERESHGCGWVDVFFGPVKPAGSTNWIQTTPGKGWFAYFRFYGPTEPYFAKTWQLNDIEPLSPSAR